MATVSVCINFSLYSFMLVRFSAFVNQAQLDS